MLIEVVTNQILSVFPENGSSYFHVGPLVGSLEDKNLFTYCPQTTRVFRPDKVFPWRFSLQTFPSETHPSLIWHKFPSWPQPPGLWNWFLKSYFNFSASLKRSSPKEVRLIYEMWENSESEGNLYPSFPDIRKSGNFLKWPRKLTKHLDTSQANELLQTKISKLLWSSTGSLRSQKTKRPNDKVDSDCLSARLIRLSNYHPFLHYSCFLGTWT